MIVQKSNEIINAVSKVLIGKRDVIRKTLMAIYANGHILLEDCPGVGKTTLAMAFAKVLGLEYKRVQFTSDTMPSDITGFSVYNKETGVLEYKPGAAMCNLLLGDEINRTSPKTQAALLETMEERAVTVDGVTRRLPRPFLCIATENPLGSAGTQALPDSQLDRFMVRLSVGYPDTESQVQILKRNRYENPMEELKPVIDKEGLGEIQSYLSSVKTSDEILRYMTALSEKTRKSQYVELGISPRGILALAGMSAACAVLCERDYVIPADVQEVFLPVCAHRLVLKPRARLEGVTAESILKEILNTTALPSLGNV